MTFLGWRDVPVNRGRHRRAGGAGRCRASASSSSQRPRDIHDEHAFELKLYVIRKLIENARSPPPTCRTSDDFYICSLSSRTIVYKGLLIADQIEPFYHDLSARIDGLGLRAGALALQHEHAGHLEAGAPLPLRDPQRRDQHAARQHQLDGRPRDACSPRRTWATTSRSCCRSSPPRPERHRHASTTPSSCCWRPAARCPTR